MNALRKLSRISSNVPSLAAAPFASRKCLCTLIHCIRHFHASSTAPVYRPFTLEEDEAIQNMRNDGHTCGKIASSLDRPLTSVYNRKDMLGLKNPKRDMMSNRRGYWTEDENKTILQMRYAGASWAAITNEINGHDINSIKDHGNTLRRERRRRACLHDPNAALASGRLQPKRPAIWTAQENELLWRLKLEGKSGADLWPHFANRTDQAIRKQHKKLRNAARLVRTLPPTQEYRWTEEEDAQLHSMKRSGLSARQIRTADKSPSSEQQDVF